MKFSNQKNGYNQNEVDAYILEMEGKFNNEIESKDREIERLKGEIEKNQSKSESIALALTAAVDKAKDIEESSKNIYKLKIEQLTILYSKWETLLNEMLKKYPAVSGISNVKEDMIKLKKSINNALKDDFNIEIMNTNPATDPIRTLLNKLTGLKARSLEEKQKKAEVIKRKSKASLSDKTELNKLEEKAPNIKPIANVEMSTEDEYENLVDKFLNSDDETENAYSKRLTISKPTTSAYVPNETGFDLNECINPTDDLAEIMKSFDFYEDVN